MSSLLNIQEVAIAIAIAIAIDQMPINGIRHFLKGNEKISWFIYCGEFSEKN